MEQKSYKFHISGMHCKACVLTTESELEEITVITKAKANLSSASVEVTGNFGDRSPEDIVTELNAPLARHGYSLSLVKNKNKVKWSEFFYAIPITILFVALYVFLQKIGLVNLVNADKLSLGTSFVIGIIASLSTCMAVVGGLVLSISATYAKKGDRVKPQMMFHLGRIISFFLLGGVIGAVGKAFELSTFGSFILGVAIALVMLLLGINLLDIFPWAKKIQPGMPRFFSRRAIRISQINHILTPFLIGISTFFLPCGFTQSMQIYTLGTGGFSQGALTMLSFTLGTLPVLALISFSSFSLQKNSRSGIFFKTAGLIVIIFALFNLINALVVVGILPPIFKF